MKKITSQLALALAVFGLAGCGLKGPLYFPKNETPQSQPASPMQSGGGVSSPAASTGQDVQPIQ